MADEDLTSKLTGKQRLFADFYLGEARFVGVRAAEMAGYKGNYSTLAAQASENLKKPNIRAYIDDRLSALTIPANEVLARLASIANGSVEDVLDEDGRFDYKRAKDAGKLGLVKKIKRKTTSKVLSRDVESLDEDAETLETSILFEEVEFEMYSAHEALRDLGKHHKLFTERTEVTLDISNLTDEELQALAQSKG